MKSNVISKNWYVAYTFPKAEKKVHIMLEKMGVLSFLPVQTVFRKWSDRMKKLVVPLFPSYIFVNISSEDRYPLTKVDGFIRYVSFEGRPSVVSDKEIDSLRRMMSGDIEVVNTDMTYTAGTPVLINQGPFAGIEGTLMRKDNKTRVIVNIWALQKSVGVSIPIDSVTMLPAR